jgi:hypothetical protein
MRRILNLKTPLLALVFGVGLEILQYVFGFCFDNIQSPLLERCLLLADKLPYKFSTWCNAEIWSWSYSSDPRMEYTDLFFDVLFGLIQWYLISLAAIGFYRHVHKKHCNEKAAA